MHHIFHSLEVEEENENSEYDQEMPGQTHGTERTRHKILHSNTKKKIKVKHPAFNPRGVIEN